ncbi:hypothetical protein O3P69_000725 [Scylla paramamosain]|uniref:Secreted protein n=1 Tax=Scylla paramamosain TaxID=85552 RepID=A0AAW0UQS7_SCYPA
MCWCSLIQSSYLSQLCVWRGEFSAPLCQAISGAREPNTRLGVNSEHVFINDLGPPQLTPAACLLGRAISRNEYLPQNN